MREMLIVRHDSDLLLRRSRGQQRLERQHAGRIADIHLSAWIFSQSNECFDDLLRRINGGHRLYGPSGVVSGMPEKGGVDAGRQHRADMNILRPLNHRSSCLKLMLSPRMPWLAATRE